MGHCDPDSFSGRYLHHPPWEGMNLPFLWTQCSIKGQSYDRTWIVFIFANAVSLFVYDSPALVGNVCGFNEQNYVLNIWLRVEVGGLEIPLLKAFWMDADITKGIRRGSTLMPSSEPTRSPSPCEKASSVSSLHNGGVSMNIFFNMRDVYQVCIWHKSKRSILMFKIPRLESWHFSGKGRLLLFYVSHLVITLSWALWLLQSRDTLGHFQVKDDFEKCRTFKVKAKVKCV